LEKEDAVDVEKGGGGGNIASSVKAAEKGAEEGGGAAGAAAAVGAVGGTVGGRLPGGRNAYGARGSREERTEGRSHEKETGGIQLKAPSIFLTN
jgi:hypothetical protein